MASELVAVVDTETTGVDPKKDHVIEASWALVQVSTAKVLEIQSRCFFEAVNAAEAINGIPVALLAEADVLEPVVLDSRVTAIVAHNAAFDRSWGVFRPLELPWLCTFEDWRWPRPCPSGRLQDVALAHGVGIVSAHRAYNDVLTLCALLERVHEMGITLAQQLAEARRPRQLYAAIVSYADNGLAKQAGFRWRPESKQWVRRMLAEEAKALPFKVQEARP
jgi:DNA polymerase-3 subunit epsilon